MLSKQLIIFLVLLFVGVSLVIVMIVARTTPEPQSTTSQGESVPEKNILKKSTSSTQTMKPIPAEIKERYKMTALMVAASGSAVPLSQSTDDVVPPEQLYTSGKVTLAYEPLSNLFEGRVTGVATLDAYRFEKQKFVSALRAKQIDVCLLRINWVRPDFVSKYDRDVNDMLTDGCSS